MKSKILLCLFTLVSFSVFSTLSLATTEVGKIPGAFQVKTDGSSSYTIPIDVLPGINNFSPDLKLTYSSYLGQSPYGGSGWSLSGISAIVRCPNDLSRDGFIDGVDFDDNDQFCFNGQRLILKQGTHGSNGAVYETEQQNFSKITIVGTQGSGPASFQVVEQNGTILEFGYTSDTRIEAQGRSDVLLWAVNKIQDSFGNYITFGYDEINASGEYYIQQIDYTGNQNLGTLPQNTVTFSYHDLASAERRYVTGSLASTSKLLEKITITNGVTVRDYTLDYQDPTNLTTASRLDSIQLCTNGACVPKTTFEWLYASSTDHFTPRLKVSDEFGRQDSAGTVNGSNILWMTNESTGDSRSLVDLNNDGYPDLVGMGGDGVYVIQGSSSGFLPSQKWSDDFGFGDYAGKHQNTNYTWQGMSFLPRMIADVNADSFSDIVGFGADGVYVALGTGNGFSPMSKWGNDFGAMTIAGYNGSNPVYWGFNMDRTRTLADINGDGYTDIVGFGWDGVYVSLNDGSSFSARVKWSEDFGANDLAGTNLPYTLYWGKDSENFRTLADVNADALLDIVAVGINGIYVAINTGSGFQPMARWTDDFGRTGYAGYRSGNRKWQDYELYKSITFADINSDGNVDVLGFGADRVLVALGTGTGFLPQETWINDFGHFSNAGNNQQWQKQSHYERKLVDVNVDGILDIVGFGYDDVYVSLGTVSGFTAKEIWSSEFGYRDSAHSIYTNYNWGEASSNRKRQVADINGDGIPDIVGFGEDSVLVAHNQSIRVKISNIVDGLGANTKIHYSLLNSPELLYQASSATYPLKNHSPLVMVTKSIEQSNGIGGMNGTSYQYSGLKMHVLTGTSVGFETLKVIDQVTGITTVSAFNQNWESRTQGLVERKETFTSGGALLNTSLSQVENLFEESSSDQYYPYVKNTMVVDLDLDGSSIGSTTTELVYDNDGLMQSKKICVSNDLQPTSGSVVLCDNFSSHELIKTTNYIYYPWGYVAHGPAKLKRESTTHLIPGRPELTATRTTEFDYYSDTGYVKQETTEPDNTTLWLKSVFTYHASGKRDSQTVTGASIAARTEGSRFDALGRAYEIYNAMGHTETLFYDDARFPTLVTRRVSANGITLHHTYNAMSQLVAETMDGGSSTTRQDFWCSTNCNNGEIFYTLSTSGGASDAYQYFDLLGREVRKAGKGLKNGTMADIIQNTVFDAQGKVEWLGKPHYEGDTEYGITTAYDNLGRPTHIVDENGESTTIQYQGKTVIHTAPLNRKQTIIKNALGQQKIVKDNRNNPIVYDYDAFGNLISVLDPFGNETTIKYNLRGFKEELNDPDLGKWTYTYDSLGQLTHQTDALSITRFTEYDLLGRKIARTDHWNTPQATTSNWYYDGSSPSQHAVGKLTSLSNNSSYDKQLTYDAFGRLETSTTTIDGQAYIESSTYDSYGRVLEVTYPTGYKTRNHYHASLGIVEKITNPVTGYTFWQASDFTASGLLKVATFSSGVITSTRGYNEKTGLTESIKTTSFGTILQDQTYQWDITRNLDYFSDNRQGVSEDYVYDDLNRLTTVAGSNGSKTVQYDDKGNITYKEGVGTYSYSKTSVPSECGAENSAAGPHAVRRIIGDQNNFYCYDKNGNLVKDGTRTLKFTAFNKPYEISKGNDKVNFDYDPERSRFKRVDQKNGVVTTTNYAGSYEKVVTNGVTTHRIYLGDFAQIIQENGSTQINYFLRDHIGSLVAVVGSLGVVKENTSFDAWGNRRLTNLELIVDPTNYKSQFTDRGFTGHEHLDLVGLIHMNGRVYDSVIGRFVSADPLIQAPDNLQSLNRYTYVMNNPLSLVDPSGYTSLGAFGGLIRGIAQMVMDIVEVAWRPAVMAVATVYGCPACGAAFIAAVDIVSGTSVRVVATSFVINTIAGGAAQIIGAPIAASLTTATGTAAGSLASAAISGAVTGAVAGGLTAAVYGQDIAAGALAGMAAGMLGASIQWTANSMVTTGQQEPKDSFGENETENDAEADSQSSSEASRDGTVSIVGRDTPGYGSLDTASFAFFEKYQELYFSLNANEELTGAIVQINKRFYFTTPTIRPSIDTFKLQILGDTTGATFVASMHTHPPGGGEFFSLRDYSNVRRTGKPMYLLNEFGDVRAVDGIGIEHGGIRGRSICGTSCLPAHPVHQ